MAAKALRNIDRLDGKPYKAGATIPEAVLAKISPQVLRSLVDAHTIEVPGMEAAGDKSGNAAHLMARLDKQGEQIKKLEAGRAEDAKTISALEKRLTAVEGKKTAKATRATA